MISNRKLEQVKARLLELAEGRGIKDCKRLGICEILQTELHVTVGVKEYNPFLLWPEYSGDPRYPICIAKRSPIREFNAARLEHRMWDARTKYGKARRRLAVWLAQNAKPSNFWSMFDES